MRGGREVACPGAGKPILEETFQTSESTPGDAEVGFPNSSSALGFLVGVSSSSSSLRIIDEEKLYVFKMYHTVA